MTNKPEQVETRKNENVAISIDLETGAQNGKHELKTTNKREIRMTGMRKLKMTDKREFRMINM